ncbi:leucine-rich repeat domain-containing protein [Pedobacter sp. 22163]|uniref:leucine-rich repeat domain-containing protein n=1 Tax=Pedobacter sp. 22163 TaxID=3453883 RepID=UPI003F87995F
MRIEILIILFTFNILGHKDQIKFENPNFERIVLTKYPEIDLNSNGRIEANEADQIKTLDLMGQNLVNVNDVKYFKNLERLLITNNKISRLKLDTLKFLTDIYCAKNALKVFEISNMPALKQISCGLNQLTHVNIKNCPNLESLNMMDNQLNKIDLSQFYRLKYLVLDNNKLKTLELSNNPELIQITVNGNGFKVIDITKNQNLKMNIIYVDEGVNIVGTESQMKNYKKVPTIIQSQ